MEAEITDLATRGATALVGLMVTEAWARVRPRFAALFGRDQEEDVSLELDEIQGEISEDPGLSEGEATQWKRRLRRALQNNPEAIAELRSLLDEFSPQQAEQPANVIHNELKDMTVHGNVVQVGKSVRADTINGNLNF
ncbi:hypothetical protein GCM10018790_52970 [Kitasatospora xanthocidica]|uniref:hypothetical protein n=1 Tax=Kitasatospora xanthocidica TaxID=83382 RepID=UPI00167505B9|nr:hypothetical protein [Kitasatospora xanthocidica]GHF68498.1 hypothetical protein GCM10018790_52970 [Kitasatospora xanthocidica]